MATSTKRIKVYSDSRAMIPPDVQAALGMPPHNRQAHVVIVATSKAEAIEIARAHGALTSAEDMAVRGRVDPEHGDSLDNMSETLRDAGLLHADAVGACYVEHGRGPVVDMTTPDRRVVGHLAPAPDRAVPVATRGRYGLVLTLTDDTNRLREAIERLEREQAEQVVGYATAEDYRLVLAAARTTLPAEEN